MLVIKQNKIVFLFVLVAVVYRSYSFSATNLEYLDGVCYRQGNIIDSKICQELLFDRINFEKRAITILFGMIHNPCEIAQDYANLLGAQFIKFDAKEFVDAYRREGSLGISKLLYYYLEKTDLENKKVVIYISHLDEIRTTIQGQHHSLSTSSTRLPSGDSSETEVHTYSEFSVNESELISSARTALRVLDYELKKLNIDFKLHVFYGIGNKDNFDDCLLRETFTYTALNISEKDSYLSDEFKNQPPIHPFFAYVFFLHCFLELHKRQNLRDQIIELEATLPQKTICELINKKRQIDLLLQQQQEGMHSDFWKEYKYNKQCLFEQKSYKDVQSKAILECDKIISLCDFIIAECNQNIAQSESNEILIQYSKSLKEYATFLRIYTSRLKLVYEQPKKVIDYINRNFNGATWRDIQSKMIKMIDFANSSNNGIVTSEMLTSGYATSDSSN